MTQKAATSVRYAVMVSDPADTADRVVLTVGTKAQARAHARRLNALAIAKHGRPRPGAPIPLYFPARVNGRTTAN